MSNFLELNVRTYACDEFGRPGVWFYSLDANCWPAVIGARWSYHLPYHWARMSFDRDEQNCRISYASRRRSADPATATRFDYVPTGSLQQAHDPVSLAFFLIERYYLFAFRNETLYTGQVHHAPYETRGANVARFDTHMLQLDDLPEPAGSRITSPTRPAST